MLEIFWMLDNGLIVTNAFEMMLKKEFCDIMFMFYA